nr:hypothetical protein [uncultured Agathobaculum sp.]
MDAKVQSFLDKVKDLAEKTGDVASCAADAARKKATELAGTTKVNLQIFDLNTECDVLFKEMGRMVYAVHRGKDVSNEEMDQKLAAVDAKEEKIAALRQSLAGMKSIVVCPHCGKACGREDAFCPGCGGAL